MLMKQVDHNGAGNSVRYGDSLTEDEFAGETFDYFLTNPPFGVDWKKQQKELKQEHDKRGFDGRFGAGLPRVNDGSLLFLQHMWDKHEPVQPAEHKHGSRLAIVFSGSPLFTGGAGSGESNIRTWIIENDWLEAIIALPEQMFYNTGIGTYIWIVTNRKEKRRKGKIQLLDARDVWTAGGSEDNKRSLGDKRRHLAGSQIAEIVQASTAASGTASARSASRTTDFGYTRVTVERPLRLRYQMTLEDKARFLDACPHLLDDVQAIDKGLGREPERDWNAVWRRIEDLQHSRESRWRATEQKLFRSVFTQKDAECRAGRQGRARRRVRAGCRSARFRERAAQGRHRRLLRTRGAPPRARRLDGPQQGQGRLRDQLQPPLLQVHATAAAGDDRRGAETGRRRDHALAARSDDVSSITSYGNIPLGWENPPVYARYSVQLGKMLNEKRITGAHLAPYLRNVDVQWNRINTLDLPEMDFNKEDREHYSLRIGDLLVCEGGEVGRTAVWNGELLECFFQKAIHRLRPITQKDEPRFFRYFMRMAVDRGDFTANAASTIQHLTAEKLRVVRYPAPPRETQRAITDYLDRETARLDALVAAKERVLALLAEKRQALITHSVTRGLNPRAPPS